MSQFRKFEGHTYRIIFGKNSKNPHDGSTRIIALARYAKKPVKGVALCHENDIPNDERGIRLAILRCNEKIATKKVKKAIKNLQEAYDTFKDAEQRYKKAQGTYDKLEGDLVYASKQLKEYLESLK